MRKKADQNNSEYGHFSRSVTNLEEVIPTFPNLYNEYFLKEQLTVFSRLPFFSKKSTSEMLERILNRTSLSIAQVIENRTCLS